MDLQQITKNSESFCLYPWTHLLIGTKGDVSPCCATANLEFLGNTHVQSVEEIWNGPQIRELRKKMLNGEKIKNCEECYVSESNLGTSMRTRANQLLPNYKNLVENTNSNGEVSQFKIPYLELQFSNLCNFSCRMCHPKFSSSWGKEAKEWNKIENEFAESDIGLHRSYSQREPFHQELTKLIPFLDKVRFTGGEPLLIEDHYLFLENLIEAKNTDVFLNYTTNLSHLKFRQWDTLEMWSQFPEVEVLISLDDSGERGEFLRKGMVWKEILQNFKLIKDRAPHVKIKVHCTVTLFNVLHFTEMMKELIELELVDIQKFSLYSLIEPKYYRTQNLTMELKLLAKEKILSFLSSKYCSGKIGQQLEDELLDVIKYMSQDLSMKERDEFFDVTRKLDMWRSESFLATFPELKPMVMGENEQFGLEI